MWMGRRSGFEHALRRGLQPGGLPEGSRGLSASDTPGSPTRRVAPRQGCQGPRGLCDPGGVGSPAGAFPGGRVAALPTPGYLLASLRDARLPMAARPFNSSSAPLWQQFSFWARSAGGPPPAAARIGAFGVSDDDRRHNPLRPRDRARSAIQNENCCPSGCFP
jgi:hypothetical protein